MHKYVIMGVQGCGKGTQAIMLARDYELAHISVGDIFRWNIQNRTKLAAQVRRIINEGNLVPDDVVEDVIRQRLSEHDWNYGFILDGFPRSHRQAQFFLESYDIDAVIHIDVSDDVVMERVLSRRLCSECGLDYNLIQHRPRIADQCDVCKGKLLTREDDNEAAIRKRIADYHEKTAPLLDLFRQKELVIKTDGSLSPEDIQEDIRRQLRLSRAISKPVE
tara:strand:+ start:688 stop:1347 length:660 start_codon:yes stop_codon:yes gene_type:complete